MRKNIQVLSALLFLQIALIVYVSTQQSTTAVFEANKNLLTVDWDQLSEVQIKDSDSKSLSLVKEGAQWVLPEHYKFPVSQTKLTELTGKLKSLKRPWPTGKTQIAAKQFNVTDEKFERKIVFSAGGKVVQTMYLGTSPTFKKIHARIDKEDLTYSISMNSYDVSTNHENWIDKDFHKLDKTSITDIKFKDLTLENKNGLFQVSSVPKGFETDRTKVRPIVSTVVNPGFVDVISDKKEDLSEGNTVLEYTVTTKEGTVTYTYTNQAPKNLPKGKDENGYKDFITLKTSKAPYYFKVRKTGIEDLIDLKQKSLLKELTKNDTKKETIDQKNLEVKENKKMAKAQKDQKLK